MSPPAGDVVTIRPMLAGTEPFVHEETPWSVSFLGGTISALPCGSRQAAERNAGAPSLVSDLQDSTSDHHCSPTRSASTAPKVAARCRCPPRAASHFSRAWPARTRS
jgi:hypothetical protein